MYMKALKTTALILMSFALFGCDNTKSAAKEKAASESSQNSQLSKEQDEYIKQVKKLLPAKFNQNASVVEVTKENNILNQKYIIEIPKKNLSIPKTQKMATELLAKLYCSNSQQATEIKRLFPDGANHNYYIGDELLFTVKLKPDSCDAIAK